MAKNFYKFDKNYEPQDQKISTNPNQKKHKENDTKVHHNQFA